MISPQALVVVLFGLSAILVLLLILRPALTANRNGKILAFVGLFALPVLCAFVGVSEQMERSKQTTFCLSCHIMEPYGRSLHVDDQQYVPAAHFQNHRIPVEQACYTCHEDYVLYGGIRAKWRGLHHVYVQYLGTPMNPIHLYVPYNNRECLHCHLGARSFEGSATHTAIRGDLLTNAVSCLTSGCHDTVHNVRSLDKVKYWYGEGR
jgi:cytochrome c-type protein NapC